MVFNQISSLTSIKKSAASKLALGSASIMMMTVIGASGVVAATSLSTAKPSKAECANVEHTSNYGQCVKKWAHDKDHGHTGYGGDHGHTGYGGDHGHEGSGNNNDVRTNVKVDQRNSSHNFASVVINYLFR